MSILVNVNIRSIIATAVQSSGRGYPMFVMILLSSFMVAPISTTAMAQNATVVEIGKGTLDSSKKSAPRFVRLDLDSLSTGVHTVRVSWDTNATLGFKVKDADGIEVNPIIKNTEQGIWQGELEGNEEYSMGLWSRDGVADYTATLEATSDTNNPPDHSIVGMGSLDSTNRQEPRFKRLEFDSLGTAVHTITVSWDSNADLRYRVKDANGNALSPIIKGSEPGVWEGELDANKKYSINLWSNDGVAGYIATVEAGDPAQPADLAITSQPADLIVTEGDSATFSVEAIGSGSLDYDWFADGIRIPGADDSTFALSSVSSSDSGTVYSVRIEDDNSSVVSDGATLTVNTAPTEPTPNGLLARWKMNESSGASVISDSSGNGRDGTIGQEAVTGVVDQGATVYRWLFTTPTGSYEPERIVNVPHYAALNPQKDDYSITMRYRTNVSFGNIIQKGQGGSPGGYWKIENPGGILTCVFRGVNSTGGWNRKEVVSSRPLNDGEYHTITCERIGSQLRLIVDGKLDDTAGFATGSISNNQPISIGGKTNCDNKPNGISCDYFSGWIDEISISAP